MTLRVTSAADTEIAEIFDCLYKFVCIVITREYFTVIIFRLVTAKSKDIFNSKVFIFL